jgi:zinc/manganese transport system ATP-binding protein
MSAASTAAVGQPDPSGVVKAEAAAAGTGPAVALQSAQVRIGGRAVWSDVSLEIGLGEFAAILGPNGSGKTTLLRVLLGELPVAVGRASVLGRQPGEAKRQIGYLPQRRHFDQGVRIRGVDLVRLGLDGARWGLPVRRSGRERIAKTIELVGASAYAARPIGRLSGGEQQRLLIAQALVSGPSLLILDEPLDSLDLPNQTAVTALLARICRSERVTVLLVAHDVNPLLPYLDRVVYFGAGHAAVGTPNDVITNETLTGLYGVPIEVLRTADGRLFVAGLPEAPAHHHDRHEHDGHA